MTTLHEIVDPWLLDDDSDDLMRLRDQLVWLQRHLFSEYEPNQYASFDDRLTEWLLNVTDPAERRSLFKLVGHLFFVAKPQFDALCRGAFNDAVVRWLIDQDGIDIADPNLSARLAQAARDTWFCPITDSMRINGFLKVNNLQGHDLRADWRSLERLGDPCRVQRHVANCQIRRVVLLEDFVGSGNQMKSTVRWGLTVLPSTPFLLVPLVCCPEGVKTGCELGKNANLTFAPTLSLDEDLFLTPDPSSGEPTVFGEIRSLVIRIRDRLGDWKGLPFGYERTGAIVALFSNCPDNTLPIIHEQNDDWKALFPRIRRE